jgi:thiamine biosynthesis lipoprotein
MKRLLLPAFIMLALLVAGCEKQAPDEWREQLYVFGTLVEIQFFDTQPDVARTAVSDLEAELQRMHRELHAWKQGLLVSVNQAMAEGRAVDAGGEIATLVRRSQAAETDSGGAFNAAIGRLIALWGFHTSEYPIIGPPPSRDAIEVLLNQRPSANDILIEGSRLSSSNPSVQLDFGGIAKGHAVDTALTVLRERGIRNAMVNAGGDLKVSGARPDRAWRVAIRDPAGGLLAILEPSDGEAVFTSGVYERFRQESDRRYPHIIDPRTGLPVDALSSVTVVHNDATWADAAATALTVAGPDYWASVAGSMGLDQVLVVDTKGNVQATPALNARLEYAGTVSRRVRVVEPGLSPDRS